MGEAKGRTEEVIVMQRSPVTDVDQFTLVSDNIEDLPIEEMIVHLSEFDPAKPLTAAVVDQARKHRKRPPDEIPRIEKQRKAETR